MTNNIVQFLPQTAIAIGIIIHLRGLISMVVDQTWGLWELWTHLSMLCLDTVLIWGLTKKMKWAFFLTIALFIQQTAFQAFFRVKYCLGLMELHSNVLNIATIVVGSVVIVVMVMKRRVFVK